jgi:hypothetical protein
VTAGASLDRVLEIARAEDAPLTTQLPEAHSEPAAVPSEQT